MLFSSAIQDFSEVERYLEIVHQIHEVTDFLVVTIIQLGRNVRNDWSKSFSQIFYT